MFWPSDGSVWNLFHWNPCLYKLSYWHGCEFSERYCALQMCPPKCQNATTLQPPYQGLLHEMWILQGCLLICRTKYTSTKLQRNLHDNNSTDKTECGHNLVSKAYKVSNRHLHHGEPWQAAMTTQLLHQLLMEDVVKHIIMSPESGHAIIQNLCPEFPLHFWKHQGDSLMMLVRPLKRQPKCNHKISDLT